MKQTITFTDTKGILKEYHPKPASAFVPDWYKNVESYIGGVKKPIEGGTPATIKRCMPVFDSITAGYIIVLPADVHISQKDGHPFYQWANYGLVEFHTPEQAPNHPNRNEHPSYPKWINPWGIKTPRGYSTLFVQPFHRESPFTILPGIVDTDKYTLPVNFPFVLNDIKFEGMLPAGTPIAQVIPFKRSTWKSSFWAIDAKERIELEGKKLNSQFFDRYKNMFRQNKEYK